MDEEEAIALLKQANPQDPALANREAKLDLRNKAITLLHAVLHRERVILDKDIALSTERRNLAKIMREKKQLAKNVPQLSKKQKRALAKNKKTPPAPRKTTSKKDRDSAKKAKALIKAELTGRTSS